MMTAEEQLERMEHIFHEAEPMIEELGNLYHSSDQLTMEQLGELQQLKENIIELGQEVKTYEKVTADRQFEKELEYQEKIMQDQNIQTGTKDLDESLALLMATYHAGMNNYLKENLAQETQYASGEHDIEKELFESSMGAAPESNQLGGSLADEKLTIVSEGADGTIIGQWSPEGLRELEEIQPQSVAAEKDSLEYETFESGIRIDETSPSGKVLGQVSPDLQQAIQEMRKRHN